MSGDEPAVCWNAYQGDFLVGVGEQLQSLVVRMPRTGTAVGVRSRAYLLMHEGQCREELGGERTQRVERKIGAMALGRRIAKVAIEVENGVAQQLRHDQQVLLVVKVVKKAH